MSGNPTFVALLQRALAAPFGVRIKTSDPTRLRSNLYNTRRALNAPAYEALTIRTDPGDPTGSILLIPDRTRLVALA